jgi:hypothetical protein
MGLFDLNFENQLCHMTGGNFFTGLKEASQYKHKNSEVHLTIR